MKRKCQHDRTRYWPFDLQGKSSWIIHAIDAQLLSISCIRVEVIFSRSDNH